MNEQFENLKQYIKENLPSAEVFEIQSLDGKKVFEQSFDEKECSISNVVKKYGLTVLFTNF